MATVKIEDRVAALEAEIAQLKVKIDGADPWKEVVWGAFADDPAFEEAMRLGREYRESLRRKPRKARPARKT
ncbi:MAG TPA: hypothetical protein VKA46_17745 [Gemmataceae bacterium]|nr:hypothetical protein [Gemmataceae bacterium]